MITVLPQAVIDRVEVRSPDFFSSAAVTADSTVPLIGQNAGIARGRPALGQCQPPVLVPLCTWRFPPCWRKRKTSSWASRPPRPSWLSWSGGRTSSARCTYPAIPLSSGAFAKAVLPLAGDLEPNIRQLRFAIDQVRLGLDRKDRFKFDYSPNQKFHRPNRLFHAWDWHNF